MSKRPKSRPNSRNKSKNRQEQRTPITPNPFLNFFLSKCGVKSNSKLHKFAKAIGNEWTNMNYHEKSPYYQLADKAKKKRLKLLMRSGIKDDTTKEERKDDRMEETKHEKYPSRDGSVTSNLKNFRKDEIPIENRPAKVLDEWLAVTKFVTPQNEALVEEIRPKSPSVGSTQISVTGSFHSMQNNCCSQSNLG